MRKCTNPQPPKVAQQNQNDAWLKIDAKIALLQAYVGKGVPSGAFVPNSLEQFRVWSDDGLNTKLIGSKSTLYQPWNRDRRIEILKLISSLTSSKKNSKKRATTPERLRIENKELKFTLRQLAGEVHKTRQELQISQRENERKDQRIHGLKEENSKLIAQLRNRAGLYPVK